MKKVRFRKIVSRIKRNAKRLIHKIQGKQYVHLLHIGKTGGTAVKYALKNHLITDKYVIKLHRHKVGLRDLPKNDLVFFFLRDPVSRFISSFYSRQRQGLPRYYFPWSPEEKAAFDYFDTPNKLAIALSSEHKQEKARAEKAMRSIFHVKDSYWKWFDNEQYYHSRLCDIFFIGFQENLSEDFNLLKLKLGLPKSLELPTDDIQAHKNPEHLDKTLEERAIGNLKNWYKQDYAFINLCKGIAERINKLS